MGGLTWEAFMAILGERVVVLRGVAAGVIYGFVWLALCLALRPRQLWTSAFLGAISPYIAIVASLFGVWLIAGAILYWWVFVPVGILVGIGDHYFRCLGATPPSQERLVCSSCGYLLFGLQREAGGVRCPECGSLNSIGDTHNDVA